MNTHVCVLNDEINYPVILHETILTHSLSVFLPTLPYPTLPYPALPYPTLSCPVLPYPASLPFPSLERVVTKPIRFIADAADLTTFKGPHYYCNFQSNSFDDSNSIYSSLRLFMIMI